MSVTVIITTYNSSSFINKTFDSIISQSLMPYKIILIDDNSNDLILLKEIVKKIKKISLKIFN